MGGIGLALVVISAFVLLIAVKGTYQYLPPWNKSPQSQIEQGANLLAQAAISQQK